MSDSTLQVDVIKGIDGYFLSDRWGEASNPAASAKDGYTVDHIHHMTETYEGWFVEESCFLVHLETPLVDTDHMALLCEFEIADDWLPDREPDDLGRNAAEWNAALRLFSPAIAHVARGLKDLPGDAGTHSRCVFDLSAFHNGAISALLPLCQDSLAPIVYDLLFRNGLAFPASAHAQFGAAQSLTWRYRMAEIAPETLPGPSRVIRA